MAVAVADRFSFEAAFFLGAAAAALAFVVGAIVRDLEPPAGNQAPVRWRQREWVSRTAVTPAIVFLTMTATVGTINAFMPLFAEERVLGNPGLFYTVWGTTLLGARFLAGAAGDRFGRTSVVVPSLIAEAIALFLLAGAETQLVLLASAALGGIALGGVQVSVMSLIVDRTPPARRGAAMATYTMAWDVGAVAGGVLLGFVIEATSYSFGFLLVGLLPLAGLVLYLGRVHRGDVHVRRGA